MLWSKTKTFPYVPNLLTLGDHILFRQRQRHRRLRVARTGEMIWSERLGGNFSASPILIDGKIYAASEDGTVYVFQAAPTYQLLAKNLLGEGSHRDTRRCQSPPVHSRQKLALLFRRRFDLGTVTCRPAGRG